MVTEGFLTTCYGPAPYRRLAVTLARCLDLHAPGKARTVVTDAPDAPELLANFDTVLELRPEYGSVFEQKLHLHHYSPYERTLYIDSDSLVVRSLDPAWEAFRGRPFAVVGFDFSWNHWFDPKRLPEELRRFEYPIFNGGLFYFERNGVEIFDHAATLTPRYDEWGIARINGHLNDEPLIAIAMACAGYKAVVDGGSIMRTLAGVQGPLRIDVFRGESRYRKYDEEVEPAIVHFAAGGWQQIEYRREALRLAMHARGIPRRLLAPLPAVTRAGGRLLRPLRRGDGEARSSLATTGRPPV